MAEPAIWRRAFEAELAKTLEFPKLSDEWSPARPPENVVSIARAMAMTVSQDAPWPSLMTASDGSLHVRLATARREISVFISPDGETEYVFVENGNPVKGLSNPNDPLDFFLGWLL